MGLSSREPARRRQLQNLKRGNNDAPVGNRLSTTHGGYTRVLADTLDAKVRDVFNALAQDAPLRENGGLPCADTVVVRLLAECLCRLDSVSADLRDHGWRDRATGEARTAVEVEQRLRREALSYAIEMGMTPRSRAQLGLAVARTVDLATAMSEPDPALRRELLQRAGVLDGDHDGDDEHDDHDDGAAA